MFHVKQLSPFPPFMRGIFYTVLRVCRGIRDLPHICYLCFLYLSYSFPIEHLCVTILNDILPPKIFIPQKAAPVRGGRRSSLYF